MPTESPQQEPLDLGKDVERAIEEFWFNCQQHGNPKKLALADCAPCRIAKEILENAIRARINEPGPEPGFEGTPFPIHQCWCKDTHSEHRDCKRRGFHRCGCGATAGLVSDRWIGGLAGKPVRTAQVPAQRFEFVDDRTSKHSGSQPIFPSPWYGLPFEPFLARFPEIERIGTPVPEGEEPTLTIITALQFKALAETVDLLIAEWNARL